MSSKEPPRNPAYPRGIAGILEQMEARRAPLGFGRGEALPPLDCDLDALRDRTVPPPGDAPASRSGHARKSFEIARELRGQSALLHLTALLIAHLRKRSQPAHCAPLFHRIWAEQSDFLLAEMDLRWKVSSLTTFGDHGATAAQRSTGLALSTLFASMKLHESERLFSGRAADRAFSLDGRARGPLPLEMNAFALGDGGLDVNLIGRLWQESETDAVIAPLAQDMLTRLIADPRTVFRRLHILRARKARRAAAGRAPGSRGTADRAPDPEPAARAVAVPVPAPPTGRPPRWGVVMTTNAPVAEIARCVAHHLERGAARIHVYLDTPCAETVARLSGQPRVTVTTCDVGYWTTLGKPRMASHQQRQAFNATRTLARAQGDLDWLCHLDVDEFILGSADVSETLAAAPDDMAAMRLLPAEALAPEPPETWPSRFKLTPAAAGHGAAVLEDIYPTFGPHLRGGFLSHVAGKVFARTGLGAVRLGIHALRMNGCEVLNTGQIDGLWLGHLHAPSWPAFLAKLAFRRSKGSYRIRPEDAPERNVGRLLAYLQDEEGPEALRVFFEETCRDSDGLRARLAAHGMLLHLPFDPEAAARRVFGQKAATDE